jgi:hypothetical protein
MGSGAWVELHTGVDQRAPRRRGRLELGHRRQRLVRDLDQTHRVLGHVAVVGDHERDQLPRVRDLVRRERPLGSRMRQAGMRDQERTRLVERTEVGGGQDQVDARQRPRPRRVDGHDPRTGVRRAQARAVERAGGLYVVDEAALPAEQARVFITRNARAD